MTYSELVTALTNLFDRGDLASQIPTFIEQCESAFTGKPEQGGIRHWRDKERLTVSVAPGENYVSLPTGFVELVSLRNNTANKRMVLESREAMEENRDRSEDTAGDPEFYRHADGAFEIRPTPAATVELEIECYRRVSRLNKQDYGEATVVTENWVSQWHPDVYIYGAALHSAPYLHDDARITTWAGLYSLAVERVNGESERASASTSSPRLRNRGLPTSRVPT